MPSEPVVIALSALSVSGGNPHLGLLAVVAAVGAFCGDQAAYTIGRRSPLRRLRGLRTDRARRAVARAETTVAQRAVAIELGGPCVRRLPAARARPSAHAADRHASTTLRSKEY